MIAFRAFLRGVGQTLITAGVVILLFCAYELWATNLYTAKEQRALGDQLERTWAEGTDPLAPTLKKVPLGAGIAVLRIPRLGRDYAKVVVEGIGRDDLKKGPGHYPGTALFGAVGNAVLSGHRTTYGSPFNRLDELEVGDAIVVETRTMWFTYVMTEAKVVSPRAIEVTYPVPGDKEAKPTKRLLTLTTCNPKYSARTRLIIFAEQSASQPKSAGLPPALQDA